MNTDVAPRTLAIVVPCHNEEESLPHLMQAMAGAEGELEERFHLRLARVFVDDGSTDQTLATLRKMHQLDDRNLFVSFSRNFGKEAALLAGLREALVLGADYIAVMDADLQDPPALLCQMLAKLESEGCDVVAAYRRTREGEPAVRSWFARRFYRLINRISDVEMRDGARDFRVMRREVAEAIAAMPERCRFSKGIFMWVGFETSWVGYDNVERVGGSTNWSFWELVRYALEGIVAFSVMPLEVISIFGLAMFCLAMLFMAFIIVRALLFGDPVAGWPSLVCVITLLSGLQLFGLGVLGMYLSKVYTEVKQRPPYVVRERSARPAAAVGEARVGLSD